MDDQEEKSQKSEKLSPEEKAKALAQVICICKGIPLMTIIKALEGSKTVAEVNQKVGTGSGGCKGERCGPKIKILLAKKRKQDQKSQ